MDNLLRDLLNTHGTPAPTSTPSPTAAATPQNLAAPPPDIAETQARRTRPHYPRGTPRRATRTADVGATTPVHEQPPAPTVKMAAEQRSRAAATRRPLRLPRWHIYEHSTTFLGVLALDLIFIGFWWVNGHFTAKYAYGFGHAHGWTVLTITVRLIWEIPVAAWGVHLLVSLVEQHTWKARAVAMAVPSVVGMGQILPLLVFCAYLLSVAIGTVDVLTTAVGLGAYFGVPMFGTAAFSWSQIGIVAFSELCAIVPEPMIVALTTMVYFIAKRRS